MAEIQKRVHVYASARHFIVVPVRHCEGKGCVEASPVRRVGVVMGRDTVSELAGAIREVMQQSGHGMADGMALWDGDQGRWWQHNLAYVQLHWCDDGVRVATQQRINGKAEAPCDWCDEHVAELEHGVDAVELAKRVVNVMGARLTA